MDTANLGTSQSHSHFRFFEIHSSTAHVYSKSEGDEAQHLVNNTKPKSLDVYADLVIVFKYKQPAKGVSKPEYEQKTLAAYKQVLQKLTRVGLQYETRPSGSDTLFIFVLCPWSVLKREETRTR